MMTLFAEITGGGFDLPQSATEFLVSKFGALGFAAESPLRHYIGYRDSAPVAVASMMLGGGAAGVYNVTSLPIVRGKGFGAALVATPLREAIREGYRYAVLQSPRESYTMYRHMGFREYCTYHSYLWSPKNQ
jgi:GNAT superfamily N-acetyltransferase